MFFNIDYKIYKLPEKINYFISKNNLFYRSKSKLIKKVEPTFLEAYILDEGFYEFNITKPCFFIYNTGNISLKNFKVHYYFTTENGLTPVLEDYCTSSYSVSLKYLGLDQWCVILDYARYILNLGERVPHNYGEIFGIHYPDPYWRLWDKSNDFSQPLSNTFRHTENIAIFDNDDELMYGNQP